MGKSFKIGSVRVGGKSSFFAISGPCVIENRALCMEVARKLVKLSEKTGVPYIFKASYDKANRTSVKGFRGPGLIKGLEVLREVKERFGLPVLTDVHTEEEVPIAADVVDVLQIPAFLCRQTDLVLACGESGAVVNIKKGQFLGAGDMEHILKKVESTGCKKIMLTERGNSFGYGNLVADMRNIAWLKEFGYPVVFDATHSVQRPGAGAGGFTPGDGHLAPVLARAAVAAGCDGVFMESHPRPAEALSDAQNLIPLAKVGPLWTQLKAIHEIVA